MRLQPLSRKHALPPRGPRMSSRNRQRVLSLDHDLPAHARPSPGQPRLRPGPAVESPHYAPAHSSECIEGNISHKVLENNLQKLATSHLPPLKEPGTMRLQSLSEPRSLFPSRGFHRPVPTPLRHAPFMSSPPGRSECAAGNNPLKTAANNLAKLATSPLPPLSSPTLCRFIPAHATSPSAPSSPSSPSAPSARFQGSRA